MKFNVIIHVMPRKELLDPQGKTVTTGLHNIGFNQISDVRIGKCIQYSTEKNSQTEAHEEAKQTCEKLLANLVMESYEIQVTEV